MLNARSVEIINLFEEGKAFTIEELAKKFQISSRAVRYDLEDINYIFSLHSVPAIRKSSEGKFFADLSQEMLDKILSSLHFNFPEKRLSYLFLKLFSENFINLTEEAKTLDVTRETLKHHVKEIKEYLEGQNLSLKSLPGKGIFLNGDEQKIRILFKEYLLNSLRYGEWNSTPYIKKLVENCFKEFSMDLLRENITTFEKSFSHKISSSDFHELLCMLLVAFKRQPFFIPESVLSFSSKEAEMVHHLANTSHIPFSVEESEKFIEFLQKKEHTEREKENRWEIFLEEFKKNLKYNLSISKEVLENIEEITDKNILENVLLEDLKEKAKSFLPKKKAVLITEIPYFLNKKIKKILKNLNITIVETLPAYLFELYGVETECDFIISTEKVSELLNIPTFKISTFPKEEEFNQIFKFLCFKESYTA